MFVEIYAVKKHKLLTAFEYDPQVNQMETMEIFIEMLEGLKPGEQFTLMAWRDNEYQE